MANAPLYWEGRIRDRCLDEPDEALDVYNNGWIEYNPDVKGFAIFVYDRHGEGQWQQTIKCNQIKPIRKKPKDRYFSFKYTHGVYFEDTEEPIFELTFHGSRDAAMTFRECVKDKCLEHCPIEGRYPKRNNPDPERKPDAVVTRHCEICKIWCTGVESWDAHIAGKEHRRNRAKVRQGCKVTSKAPPPMYHCDICDADCTGDDPWQAHLNGAPHKRREKRFKGLIPKTSLPNPGEFHCDICDVDAYDQDHLDIHLQGKPHKRKAAKALYSDVGQNYPRANSVSTDYSSYTDLKTAQKELEAKLKLNDEKTPSMNENVENWLEKIEEEPSSSANSLDNSFNEAPRYKWKTGDACWALYEEDGLYYPAFVHHVDAQNETCIVEWEGFGDKEEVFLKDIYSNADWN